MNTSSEHDQFSTALKNILRADPKVVQASMAADKRDRRLDRAAKGQRKRGRKTVKKQLVKGAQ
jgi:hypothetical protein